MRIFTHVLAIRNFTLRPGALIVWLSLPVLLFSANNTDSLLRELPSARGQQKLELLVQMASNTFNNAPDSCISYTTRARDLAQESDAPDLQAKALYFEGLARNYLGQYIKSTKILQQAVDIQNKLGLRDSEASSLMALGITYENRGMLGDALNAHTRAFELFQKTQNQKGIAQSLLNVGCVLNRKKDFEHSVDYFKQALETATAIDHKPTMAAAYNNLGIVNDLNNKKIEALDDYAKSLALQESMGNKREMAHLNNNIALVYLSLDRFAKARAALEKSIALKKEINDTEGIANSFNQIAEIYLKQQNFAGARHYVDSALNIADTAHSWIVYRQAYNILAQLEEQAGNYQKAIVALRKSAAANDTVFNITSSRQIAEMQARFETNRKEQENMILRQQVKIETDRAAHHRSRVRLLTILVLITLMSSALLFALFRQRSQSLIKTRTIMTQEKEMATLLHKNQQSEMKRLEAERQKQQYENELLEEKITAQEEINRLEKEKLQADLEKRSSELSALTLHLVNNNEILGRIKKQIAKLQPVHAEAQEEAKRMVSLINQHIDPDLNWKKFRVNFDEVHPGFFDKLHNEYPSLTDNDLKLCAFLRVNLQSKEIAQIMNVSLAAVNKGRQRLRKNLNLPPQSDLHVFLSHI